MDTSPGPAGRTWAAPVVLVGVAAAWGLSIGISKDLLETLPVADYLALRYGLGAAVLVALRPRVLATIRRVEWSRGAVLGALYAVAQFVQFAGLARASIVVASFLVSLYVVFTPILLSLIRRARPPGVTVTAVLIALAGVALMSVRGWSFGLGESLTVLSALIYAIHVVAVGRWAVPGRATALTVVQLTTMALIFLAAAAPGGMTLPTAQNWPAMGFVVVIGGASILAQVWAQARLNAETAAIIMVLEPVWASLFAVLWWSESPDLRTIVGGALVVTASSIVIVASARVRRRYIATTKTAVVRP